MALKQKERLLSLVTPLGPHVLVLTSFSGREELSRLGSYHLDMLSDNASITAKDLVGKNVTWSVKLKDDTPRHFNGFVSRLDAADEAKGRRNYRAEALLSKTSVVMLPLILLLMTWWQSRSLTRRDFLAVVPFLVVAAAMGVTTVWANAKLSGVISEPVPFTARLAGAAWIVWFYLYKAVCPFRLCAIYPAWSVNERSMVAWLPGLALLLAFFLLWRYRNRGSLPALVGLASFVIILGRRRRTTAKPFACDQAWFLSA